MPICTRKKLIGVALPLETINAASARERSPNEGVFGALGGDGRHMERVMDRHRTAVLCGSFPDKIPGQPSR